MLIYAAAVPYTRCIMGMAEAPSLRSMLDRFEVADGPMRLIILHQIRTYLNSVSKDQAAYEISMIYNTKELDVVIGAGARGVAYYMLLRRKLELM